MGFGRKIGHTTVQFGRSFDGCRYPKWRTRQSNMDENTAKTRSRSPSWTAKVAWSSWNCCRTSKTGTILLVSTILFSCRKYVTILSQVSQCCHKCHNFVTNVTILSQVSQFWHMCHHLYHVSRLSQITEFLYLDKFWHFKFKFQTEASLTNLQKSIHPLAMNKLKGILDLQHELAKETTTLHKIDTTTTTSDLKHKQTADGDVNKSNNNKKSADSNNNKRPKKSTTKAELWSVVKKSKSDHELLNSIYFKMCNYYFVAERIF